MEAPNCAPAWSPRKVRAARGRIPFACTVHLVADLIGNCWTSVGLLSSRFLPFSKRNTSNNQRKITALVNIPSGWDDVVRRFSAFEAESVHSALSTLCYVKENVWYSPLFSFFQHGLAINQLVKNHGYSAS
jgi:hypothetical protein